MRRVRLRVRTLLLMVLALAVLLGGLQAVRRWAFCRGERRRFEAIAMREEAKADRHREDRMVIQQSLASLEAGPEDGRLDRRSRAERNLLLKQVEYHLRDEEAARALATEAREAADAYRRGMARPWDAIPPTHPRGPDRPPTP